MKTVKKSIWISYILTAFAVLIMLLAATQAAEAKTAKAKIDPDYKTVTLEYNSHINSNYMFEAQTGIEQLLLNSSKKATYTAVIKNKKVAKFINNKNDLLTDKKVIAATGTGTTTATIYEKKSGEKKKTKIGTVKIWVKKAKMAEARHATQLHTHLTAPSPPEV